MNSARGLIACSSRRSNKRPIIVSNITRSAVTPIAGTFATYYVTYALNSILGTEASAECNVPRVTCSKMAAESRGPRWRAAIRKRKMNVLSRFSTYCISLINFSDFFAVFC